ncbi:unnamed protein product [Effrenium voratum]|uniref:J domain-containing protein n=1 Tax=Effrenium voratum TaxID=2562239 RepID=A0AA36HUS4_9DINO|nr:unnamed protein product [Effrenium voratum]
MFDFESLEAEPDIPAPSLEERWRAMGLEPERGVPLESLEALGAWKPKELRRECERQGLPVPPGAEKGELLASLRKVLLWQQLPASRLRELLGSEGGAAEDLVGRLISQTFQTPAPARRFGDIFAPERAAAWAKPEPPEPQAPGGAGTGSQAFKANLAAQGISQGPKPRPSFPTGGYKVPGGAGGSPPTAKPRPTAKVPTAKVTPEVAQALRTLGLDHDSDEEKVKKSYRRLALLYHPDKNGSADAELFKSVTRAYEICCGHFQAQAGGGQKKRSLRGTAQMSFRSKMKRLAATTPGSSVFTESTIAKNPGPGSYQNKGCLEAEQTLDLQPAVKPVLKDVEKTTPSVPPTRYLPGQVPQTEAAAADMARLSSRHTGEPRDMAGPGEYDVETQLIKNSQVTTFHKPKGPSFRRLWEASVAIDSKMPVPELPGPGAYETLVGAPEPKGAASQFNSKVPKAHEREAKEHLKTPGPGAYDMPGHLEKGIAETQERRDAVAMSLGFGSLTERVGWSRQLEQPYKDPYNVKNVPGPGHYPETQVLFKEEKVGKAPEKRKKLHGVHHPALLLALQETEGPLQAFNTSDDRPCNKDFDQLTPAPWQYAPETARGTSITSNLKERAKVGRRGVFGTCADRFYGSPMGAKEGPDPIWDGGTTGVGKDPGSPEARSSFKSTSPRMQKEQAQEVHVVALGDLQTPAPGEYDIKEPNYRSPYRIPRSEHLSFGSGTTRFTEKQEVFTKFKLPEGPAPGDYQMPSKSHVLGAARLKDKRKPPLVGSTTTTVGPGSYGTSTETSLLKKTFNVTTQARSLMHGA